MYTRALDDAALRISRFIFNWVVVLTSPVWVLPLLLGYMLFGSNGEATGKTWFMAED